MKVSSLGIVPLKISFDFHCAAALLASRKALKEDSIVLNLVYEQKNDNDPATYNWTIVQIFFLLFKNKAMGVKKNSLKI